MNAEPAQTGLSATRPDAWLVFFAVEEEAAPFRRRVGQQTGVKIVVTGMGAVNSERAFHKALAEETPLRLLTCGFAGGLDPDLTAGTVLFEAEPNSTLAMALLKAGARPGRFHCSTRVACASAEKLQLRQVHGADAVEMESGVIRRLAAQAGVPSATVRVVLDPAGRDLPLDFNLLMDSRQELSPARLALALARAPWKVPALIAFRGEVKRASERLAETLCAVLEAWPGRA